jgi:HSP20 family protein
VFPAKGTSALNRYAKPVTQQAAKALSTKSDVAVKSRPTYARPLVSPLFSGFDEFFVPAPFWGNRDPFEDLMMPVLRNLDRNQDGMVLRHSSPALEINETDTEFQIAIDVPGVKATDMTVQLEDDGRVLHLQGGRKVTREGQVVESKFQKRFTIGENIDSSKLSADLSDGVLVVKAPKIPKEEVKPVQIQITEGQSSNKVLEDTTAAEAIEEQSKAEKEKVENDATWR